MMQYAANIRTVCSIGMSYGLRYSVKWNETERNLLHMQEWTMELRIIPSLRKLS